MGKIGRIASEEVTLQLIKSKCIPVLLYGLEAYPLNKTQTQSLDFVINRLFTKLFNTSDIALVKQCQEQFYFTLPSVTLERNLCISFVALTSRNQAVVYVRYTNIDIALPLYFSFVFLFHYYFCCILLPYVANKDFHFTHNELSNIFDLEHVCLLCG